MRPIELGNALDDTLSELDREIGARLRLARDLSEYSSNALCTDMEIIPSELRDFETGRARISAKLLARFATVLNVEIRWFFSASAPRSKHPETTLRLLPPLRDRETLAALIEQMTQTERDASKAA